MFNIRNYSPEVINIQRREAELNIILPMVNNFDIKQKKACNICFIMCYPHQTGSGKIKTKKTQQHFYFILKSLTHEQINRIRIFNSIINRQLIRD